MSRRIPIVPKSDSWILDDEGDVMLVVGTSEPCRIRVSSKILSLASDVFKGHVQSTISRGLKSTVR